MGKAVKQRTENEEGKCLYRGNQGRKKMKDGVRSRRKEGEAGGRLENGKERMKNLENLGNRLRERSCNDIYGSLKLA